MIFFENNDIDLLSYLPNFMQEYREIKKIMESEEPEFKVLWEKFRIVFENQFIEHCNEDGISKFENMLGLQTLPDDTLEIRIFRVLTYWNARVPFTWRVLVNNLNQLCESPNNYELDLDNDKYNLNITTKFDDNKKFDELNKMLKLILPANLGVNNINLLTPKQENSIYLGSAVIENKYYRIGE